MNKLTNHGFTLVEMLLYVVISGSLLMAATTFFFETTQARIKNQSISEVNQQGEAAMRIIEDALRGASSINSPGAGTSASTLNINATTPVNNPTVFDLNSNKLRIKEGSAAAIDLTGGVIKVTNLTFTNLSRVSTPGVVRVSFSAERDNQIGRNEYDYKRDFILSVSLRK